MEGRALCLEVVVGRSAAFVRLREAGLRASSSQGGRKVLERYTTRQMQPMSKQDPAQVKTDNETVLDVEMCGAVRWCAVVVLEGELRRGRWASNGGAAGGGGESKRVFPESAKNAKERWWSRRAM